MIHIAVCDNDHCFCRRLERYVSNYMIQSDIPYHVDTFHTGEKFVDLGIELSAYTIVFLDVKMNRQNGIMIARKIREISKEIFIVFVTADVNYVLEGYKVGAVRYILKDTANLQNEIDECMSAIIEKINYKIIRKTYKFSEGTKEISLNRLLYIESRLHKLEFHIVEDGMKVYTMYEVLNNLASELEESGFVRIHQSYLVNLKHIKSIERYKAVLDNGVVLMIPKARYAEVKNKFAEYIKAR